MSYKAMFGSKKKSVCRRMNALSFKIKCTRKRQIISLLSFIEVYSPMLAMLIFVKVF